jgi:hypothetical protein
VGEECGREKKEFEKRRDGSKPSSSYSVQVVLYFFSRGGV